MTDPIRPAAAPGQPDGAGGRAPGHPSGPPDAITAADRAADRMMWQRFRRTAPAFSAGSVADPLLLAGWRDGRLTDAEAEAVEAMLVEDARRGGGQLDDLAAAVLAEPVPVSPALAARLRDLPDRAASPAAAPTGRAGMLARVIDDLRPMHWLRAGSVAAMLLATLYAGGTAYQLGRDTGSADRNAVAADGWNLGDSGADLDAGDLL